MKYKVDLWNNFCRVFEIPVDYTKGFCFGGGLPAYFQMVDWFNPCPEIGQAGVSKEVWEKEVGPIKTTEIDLEELEKELIPFLKQKKYINPNREYLILYSFGASSVFKP